MRKLALFCLLLSANLARSAVINVDAKTSTGPLNTRIFGHNVDTALSLGDADSKVISPSAMAIIQDAGCGKDALVRFPSGEHAERYHWRRGVGVPGQRPSERSGARLVTNEFGTDEFMAFIHKAFPNAQPLITVDWWDFNNPKSLDYDPAKGRQEAANWVEYCDGVSPGLKYGLDKGWRASQFRDAPGGASTDPTAQEWADGVKAWRSNEKAPAGYFAWLREYFAALRGKSDPGPYNVRHWEIGNEMWGYSTADVYRQGVIDYASAMRPASPIAIKIGACMDDRAGIATFDATRNQWTPSANPGICPWDKTVLNAGSASSIDFLAFHPASSTDMDDRYSRYLRITNSSGNPQKTAESLPMALDPATAYTFRLRAQGFPRNSTPLRAEDYPGLKAVLVLESGETLDLRAAGVGRYRSPLNDSEFRAVYPAVGEKPEYTKYEDKRWPQMVGHPDLGCYRSDYCFQCPAGTLKSPGSYRLRLEVTGTDAIDDFREIRVMMASRSSAGSPEQVLQFRTVEDQAAAAYAAPLAISRRMKALRDYANSIKPGIELAGTEFSYSPGISAYPDQSRDLKGAIAVAELMREMLDPDVDPAGNRSHRPYMDYACLWHLNSYYYHVAQPNWAWDPIRGETVNPSEDMMWQFVSSPVACVFHLFTHHSGGNKLACKVTDVPTFDNSAYGAIPAIPGVPYLSALATGDYHDGACSKVYVMVINKDWRGASDSTVNVSGIPKFGKVTVYTLKCWDDSVNALDAQNDYDYLRSHGTNRISIRETSLSDSDISAGNGVAKFRCSFPPSSITVLEVSAAD